MKNMINTLALTIAIGTSSVYAADNNFYAGLNYGLTDVDSTVTNTTGSISLDKKDSGFKIFAGYQFNKNIAVEGFYSDLGSFSLTGIVGETYTLNGQAAEFLASGKSVIDAATFGVTAVFSLPISDNVSPYAKLGFHRWDMKGNEHLLAAPGLSNEDGSDVMYGLGVNVSLNDSLSLRVEYERFKTDSTYADNIDYASVGVAYSF